MLRPDSKDSNLVGVRLVLNPMILCLDIHSKNKFLKLLYCTARLENYCPMQYSLAFI